MAMNLANLSKVLLGSQFRRQLVASSWQQCGYATGDYGGSTVQRPSSGSSAQVDEEHEAVREEIPKDALPTSTSTSSTDHKSQQKPHHASSSSQKTAPTSPNAGSSAASSGTGGPAFLIFGASGGIGSALARRLSRSGGGAVLAFAGSDNAHLKQLQDEVKTGDVFTCDATVPEQVEEVVQKVLQKHGKLDGVANCVGNVVAKSTTATQLHDLEETVKVNLYSSFNILQSSVKAMLNIGGGSVVLISAAVAETGVPNFEAMSAAKAGVEGLARSAAATYASHNIRVNCVAPGLTHTPQTTSMTEKPAVAEASKQAHPVKRFAEPKDIAAALDFFLQPENSFITGQLLAVDGGLSTLQPRAESNQSQSAV